jgi:hypothetical protein
MLRCVWETHTVRNPGALEIAMKFVIFTTPVRLDNPNLCVQKALNMCLKRIENLLNIRLVLKEVDPTKTRIIIDKTNIIFVTTG